MFECLTQIYTQKIYMLPYKNNEYHHCYYCTELSCECFNLNLRFESPQYLKKFKIYEIFKGKQMRCEKEKDKNQNH